MSIVKREAEPTENLVSRIVSGSCATCGFSETKSINIVQGLLAVEISTASVTLENLHAAKSPNCTATPLVKVLR